MYFTDDSLLPENQPPLYPVLVVTGKILVSLHAQPPAPCEAGQ